VFGCPRLPGSPSSLTADGANYCRIRVNCSRTRCAKAISQPFSSGRVASLRSTRQRHRELCPIDTGLEAVFDGLPVDVGEKRFDVFGSFSGLVVEQEGVLPYVHYQHRLESRNVADLMQAYPVIAEPAPFRILKADRPANAAHFADANKVGLPYIIAAKSGFGRFIKRRLLARIARSPLVMLPK
jgi:hypothetical protein